jgi:Protein of unknown function (DUF974)
MRLRKPTLVPQITPSTTAPSLANSPLSQLKDSYIIDETLDGNGITGLAALPNGFGNMFVGTNFLAYVCLNNESEHDIKQVQITAEIRSQNAKQLLIPAMTRLGTKELTSETTFTLNPGEALHQILDHSSDPF